MAALRRIKKRGWPPLIRLNVASGSRVDHAR
jgi:hypothetical protein